MAIYDTPGIEMNRVDEQRQALWDLVAHHNRTLDSANLIHVAIYTINAPQGRYQDFDCVFFRALIGMGVPVVVVCTHAQGTAEEEQLIEALRAEMVEIRNALAEEEGEPVDSVARGDVICVNSVAVASRFAAIPVFGFATEEGQTGAVDLIRDAVACGRRWAEERIAALRRALLHGATEACHAIIDRAAAEMGRRKGWIFLVPECMTTATFGEVGRRMVREMCAQFGCADPADALVRRMMERCSDPELWRRIKQREQSAWFRWSFWLLQWLLKMLLVDPHAHLHDARRCAYAATSALGYAVLELLRTTALAEARPRPGEAMLSEASIKAALQ